MARNMVIAGILLLLMTFGGCASDRVEFSAGKHEKEDAYQLTFDTMQTTVGTLNFHVESALFDQASADMLLETVQSDLKMMEEAGVSTENAVAVYVVPETLTGLPQIAGDQVFCTKAAIENGEYRQCLVQAKAGQKAIWKWKGLTWYIFNQEPKEVLGDTEQLRAFYEMEDHLAVLSLFPAYFSDTYTDERTMDMAENTACSLTDYIIEGYGMDSFLKDEDMTRFRSEWLDVLGASTSVEELPIIMDQVQWFADEDYPLLLTYENFSFYFEPVNWLASADEIYTFLVESFDAYNAMVENLQTNEPEVYAMLEENMEENVHIYFKNYENMESVSRAYSDHRVILSTDELFCHEIVHLWVSNADPNIAWLSEGLANVISMPGAGKYDHALIETYRNISGKNATMELKPVDRRFMDEVQKIYLNSGRTLESESDADYAFIYNAIGTVLLTSSQPTTLAMATRSMADIIGLPATGGNTLSYPEAYALVRYLSDVYGMDAPIKVLAGECSFEDAFGGDFQDVLEDFQLQY